MNRAKSQFALRSGILKDMCPRISFVYKLQAIFYFRRIASMVFPQYLLIVFQVEGRNVEPF